MASEVHFTVNGKARSVSAEAGRTLLEVLREDLDLTGTKYGCGEGACRACTVLVEGRPVQSCMTPAAQVAGKKIETIEGLAADSQLHPVQKAFLEADALQCGFCIPGMIMTTVALLRNNPAPSKTQIRDALNGNICRCCGYSNILQAVEKVAGGGAK